MSEREWTGDLNYRLIGETHASTGAVELRGQGPFASEVTIGLYRTTAGMWTWRWKETWLGHACVSEPRASWLHREHALDALRQAARLYRLTALSDHLLTWRL